MDQTQVGMVNNKNLLFNDLSKAIAEMLANDGINYMEELDNMKIIVLPNGDSNLIYKDKPYCVWSEPKIEFGYPDELNITIRSVIKLQKL